GCLQEGIPERREEVLNQLLPAMIPSLSREAGPDIRLRIAPTSRTLRVEINAPLLERAVTHLVRNAREASGPGEDIRISWGPATHGDPGVRESDWARIRVGDRGVGIEREVLPWLFEPFFSSRSDGSAFRGLGLPLVQAVVEGHGGWVEVRSTQGEGTEVDLFLPLLTTRDTASEPEPSDDASTTGGGRAPRILLLEDEPLLARLIRRVLTREGYLVDVVDTSADAEPGMREYRDSVDLLIVEKELTGGVSGIELAEGWRSVRPGLAVVVLDRRGVRDSEEPAGGDSIGDLPLIRRPFEPADLLVRVREALRPPPEPQSRAQGDAGPSGSAPVEGIGGERGKELTH
ncbi:MAG: ATP-binding protein, partial [Gemmatimonadota bacterium]